MYRTFSVKNNNFIVSYDLLSTEQLQDLDLFFCEHLTEYVPWLITELTEAHDKLDIGEFFKVIQKWYDKELNHNLDENWNYLFDIKNLNLFSSLVFEKWDQYVILYNKYKSADFAIFVH